MHSPPSTIRPAHAGFSLVEALTTVAVIGFLAAAAVSVYGRVMERSRLVMAEHTVEVLNNAVNLYVQIEGEDIRSLQADAASSSEEVAVVAALQAVTPGDPSSPGGYLRPDYQPSASASTEDFRAVWNGAYFQLLEPGEAGAGLKIVFDASDLGR